MDKDKPNHCPLCESLGNDFFQQKSRKYYQCGNCFGIFVDPGILPNRVDEKLRYDSHNNDTNDKRYRKFVSPITDAIVKMHSQKDKGLDFGAGPGPVISEVLLEQHFNIVKYDPFYYNSPKLLNEKYNYIVCCEVIEHFHSPAKEILLLKDLLLPGAKIYCMTHLYDESIDFTNWYYKNDNTHVFIYHKNTIQWIKKHFDFSAVTIEERLITFTR